LSIHGRRTPHLIRLAVSVAVAGLLASCAMPRGHALTPPKIWDVAAQRFVDEDTLVANLARARFRLLGEVHDNPEHHRIRAELIRRVAAMGIKPAVALEQFDLDHDPALVAAQAAAHTSGGQSLDADALATAGALDRRGWMWPLHRPVLAAALDAGLAIRAANLPRADLMRAARSPPGTSIDARWSGRFASAPWTPAREAALRSDIADGHCGKLPDHALAPIVRAQRMRDAAMAEALVDAATPDGAILIAGDGHVRRDVAVPVYLDPGAGSVVSVGLVETEADERREPELSRRLAATPPPYDFVWFTEATARDDPCAGFPAQPGR
jgi:uncharacterized iron-regulated protein